MHNALKVGVFPLLLIGCIPQNANENNLAGMRSQQIVACLGKPPKQASIGARELWTYRIVACQVNIEMTNGEVSKIAYFGADGAPLTKADECIQNLVRLCGRKD